MGRKPKKKYEELTEIEKLKEQVEYLRTENKYLKKLIKLGMKEKVERYKNRKLFTP